MSWRDFPFLLPREEGVFAVGHRGGMGEAAENSLEAFRRAVSLGCRYLEIDIRASADGSLVVWHGIGRERIRPDRPVNLYNLRRAAEKAGRDVVYFADVLEELPEDVRFFLDIKNQGVAKVLARHLHRVGATDRVCIGSFSHARTKIAAKAVYEETRKRPCTTMTPPEFMRLLIRARAAGRNGSRRWRAPSPSVQIPIRTATPRVIETAHRGGALVTVWTVNDEATMHRLLDAGADGIMTDYPALLRDVLAKRGERTEPRRTAAQTKLK